MTKSFKYYIYLLLLLVIFGCGNTLVNQINTPEVVNGNSVSRVTSEFKLTKIKSVSDFDQLPRELSSFKTQIGQFDFYLSQAPTQNSGGFAFQTIKNSDPLVVCLKKPAPLSKELAVLTNPIALIKVSKGLNVKMDLSFCER